MAVRRGRVGRRRERDMRGGGIATVAERDPQVPVEAPVADAYLEPLQVVLQERARGGWLLDVVKTIVALASLVFTIPLSVAFLFLDDGRTFVAPLRWTWRNLESLQSDVEAAKSALANDPEGAGLAMRSQLYEFLEKLDPQTKPSHVRLASLADELGRLRGQLVAPSA